MLTSLDKVLTVYNEHTKLIQQQYPRWYKYARLKRPDQVSGFEFPRMLHHTTAFIQ